MTRAVVTLPPVPRYMPNGDETLHFKVPALMLQSGRDTVVQGLQVTVLSDMADCRVGEWGPWSGCDEVCKQGKQTRQRQVLRAPRGEGSACPPVVEDRRCNTCDQCSTTTCLNDGLCVAGACKCKPGFSGPSCEGPPKDPDSVYFYIAQAWNACSAQCGGGR